MNVLPSTSQMAVSSSFANIIGTRRIWGVGCLWIVLLLLFMFGKPTSGRLDGEDLNRLRLHNDLFVKNKYNRLIRPVVNTKESLMINFTLSLSAIIRVDEKKQIMITNVWLQMYWYDYQLVWNPADYGGIRKFSQNSTKVWTPDIVLFNNADGKFEPSYAPNVVVECNGALNLIPPAIYTSSCSIDVAYFPFDQQVCEMKLGSWTYMGRTLTYIFQEGENNMVLSDYMKNGAWDIMDCPGRIENATDSVTGEEKEMIVYRLVLRRKTLFFTVNLIIPCLLHAIVCICVFMIPADVCEKITLAISVLVSLSVFLLVVQKTLPPSMKVPLVGKYLLFTFIMNVLEILVAIFITYYSYKTPYINVMPKWMCWLFLYKIPKYICMKRPDHNERCQPKVCSPPPVYPDSPELQRCTNTIKLNTPGLEKRLHGTTKDCLQTGFHDSNHVRNHESCNQQHHLGSTHSDCLLLSCSTSVSQMSSDEPNHTPRMNCTLASTLSRNGHQCMLRKPKAKQFEDISASAEKLEANLSPDKLAHLSAMSLMTKTREFHSAKNAITFICDQMKSKEDCETALDDWKYVAAVVDRLFAIIFVLVTLGGTVGVLVNAPHLLETVDQDDIIHRITHHLPTEF